MGYQRHRYIIYEHRGKGGGLVDMVRRRAHTHLPEKLGVVVRQYQQAMKVLDYTGSERERTSDLVYDGAVCVLTGELLRHSSACMYKKLRMSLQGTCYTTRHAPLFSINSMLHCASAGSCVHGLKHYVESYVRFSSQRLF